MPCDSLPRWAPHYPPRDPHWTDETAPPEEQARLKAAHAAGATIEGKGRDTLDIGYTWAVLPNPKWDFRYNHYRLAATGTASNAQG